MNPWVGYGLLDSGLAVLLVVMLRRFAVLDQRQRRVAEEIEADQVDLDQRPEFDPAPPDWPLRESPARQLERAR